MHNISQEITQLISQALIHMGFPDNLAINLEHPGDETHGDYSSNIALKIFSNIQQNKLNMDSPEMVNTKFTLPKNPFELATKISEYINNTGSDYLSKTEVAGPGFVNFYLSDHFLLANLDLVIHNILINKKDNISNRRKAIVEYSSPNIAKPFTIGHLRSTIIGDALANILEYAGWEVFRDNHLGDWGTQFGKQIYAIKTWGSEQEIENSDQPVKKLVELYVKFHQEAEQNPGLEAEGRKWFKLLEDGDPESRRLWQKCIDWSWQEFSQIYKRLGVTFTENNGKGYGESYFEDKMSAVIQELKAKNLLTQGKDGAQLVFFSQDKYPPLMILKGDGATLYATRDLATDKFRLTNNRYLPNLVIINEVGAEQEGYFKQLFEVEHLLGWIQPGQRIHLKHGHFRFADKKMSTRKGNVIWLSDVIDEAVKRAGEIVKEREILQDEVLYLSGDSHVTRSAQNDEADLKSLSTSSINTGQATLAEIVGIGALKWNDLKGATAREIVFDWDEMLNMHGNSGPYVQYTFARCLSVLKKASKSQISNIKHQILSTEVSDALLQAQELLKDIDLTKLDIVINNEEGAVLRHLYRFGEAVEKAASEYAPHVVAGYVYELAQRFNTFYNKHSILGDDIGEILRFSGDSHVTRSTQDDEVDLKSLSTSSTKPQKILRLEITLATARLLKTGLNLLGIQAPEKM